MSQKSLADGIPPVEQVISESGASIPLESQHASCAYETRRDFSLISLAEEAKRYHNRLWGDCPVTLQTLHYTTEDDIVGFVKTFIRDIANAMGIPLELATNFGIKHVAPDICILSLGKRLVGVVEIKKPQNNVLHMPTVLGELFDQMILVEGFYMSGPVVGILTTLVEWMFCWFPADEEFFKTTLEAHIPTSAFLTPQKAPASVDDSASPPRETPSRRNRWSHGIEVFEDTCDDLGEFTVTEEPVERSLQTSPVINAYTDYDLLLRYLCSAFTRMTQVKLNQRLGVPRSLFKFHRGDDASPKISFHPVDGIPLAIETIRSNRYPRANTKMLLALEDLGRGSTGKAWLCCTLSASPALCVLKFCNNCENVSARLNRERLWWHAVYPEFKRMTKVEVWGGSEALVMPHICAIPEDERGEFKDKVYQLMLEKFHRRGFEHGDVAWRNIGFYLDKKKEKIPVLYDLERVSSGGLSDAWIAAAMLRLFPE